MGGADAERRKGLNETKKRNGIPFAFRRGEEEASAVAGGRKGWHGTRGSLREAGRKTGSTGRLTEE